MPTATEPAEPRVGRPRGARPDPTTRQASVEPLEGRGRTAVSLAAIAEVAGTTTAAIRRWWGPDGRVAR